MNLLNKELESTRLKEILHSAMTVALVQSGVPYANEDPQDFPACVRNLDENSKLNAEE